MRFRVLLAATVLALVTLACGPCGMVSDLVGGGGPDIELPDIELPEVELPEVEIDEEEAEEAPDATTAPVEEEEPTEAGGGVGGSLGVEIPVYPGATTLAEELMPSLPVGEEEYDVAEAWSYETNDALDKVVDFYLTEMPKQGFEKTMGASMGEGHVSVWAHRSEGVGVSMVIAEQEDGKTVIAIVAGK